MKKGNSHKKLWLNHQELTEVQRILHEHVPKYDVWAFGSRVTGEARKYSDLDLVVVTDSPLALSLRADLSDSFDESDLSFKVDIVDWSMTSPTFKKNIENDKVVIQKGQH